MVFGTSGHNKNIIYHDMSHYIFMGTMLGSSFIEETHIGIGRYIRLTLLSRVQSAANNTNIILHVYCTRYTPHASRVTITIIINKHEGWGEKKVNTVRDFANIAVYYNFLLVWVHIVYLHQINHRVNCLFTSWEGKIMYKRVFRVKIVVEEFHKKIFKKGQKHICWLKTFCHCSFGIHLTSIINA